VCATPTGPCWPATLAVAAAAFVLVRDMADEPETVELVAGVEPPELCPEPPPGAIP
jgi:hypothetical protein